MAATSRMLMRQVTDKQFQCHRQHTALAVAFEWLKYEECLGHLRKIPGSNLGAGDSAPLSNFRQMLGQYFERDRHRLIPHPSFIITLPFDAVGI